MCREYFGEGAEQLVYRMSEVDIDGRLVGTPLVAEESLYRQEHNTLFDLSMWHKNFVKIQMRSNILANKFNERLSRLGISRDVIPRIEFLDCFVYECDKMTSFLSER